MSQHQLTCALLLLAVLSGPVAWSDPAPPPVSVEEVGSEAARFRRYALPVGTPFHVLLQTRVHTAFTQPSEPVEARMLQDLYLYERVMLTRNARFVGNITQLEPPMEGKNAVLAIRFHTVLLENGERLPINAYIKTERPDHTWGGELTPGTVPKTVTHRVYGIGDYNKTIFTGPRAMGSHIEFLPGERWTLILEEPLTIVQPAEAI